MSAASTGTVMPRGASSLAGEWLRRVRERVEIGDHVGAVLRLRQADERHLGALDEGLRLPEPCVERVYAPIAALFLERIGEREAAMTFSDGLVEDAVEIGTDAIRAALVEGVASRAFLGDILAGVNARRGEQRSHGLRSRRLRVAG